MVTVEVDGCIIESQTIAVDVFDTPTAAPTATASTICENGDLALTANATGQGNLSYQWMGPNGFNSSLENPNIINVTPANNGQYILTVSSGTGCVITESITVTNVLETPEPPTIATANICEGENIVLTTSAVGSLYEWIGPLGSSTSTLAIPGLTTTTSSTSLPINSDSYLPGDWSVRVTDSNGCTSISDAVTLTINEIPVAQAFNGGAICEGDATELSASFVNGASYEWRVVGNPTIISTLQNPIITDVVGTTTYELTVVNNGCISDPVATTTVTVEETPATAPSATYSLNGDCSPSDLELFANVSVGNITSYEWIGPSGYTANVANPLIENADETNNGSYILTVTTSGGCTVSESIQVVGIVDQQAQPIITSSGPACGGETIELSIPAYAGANVDYVWNLPSTINVTGENTNQIIISPVSYTHLTLPTKA